MVRTLDNKARAFLSDRYRPLDNFDLATAVLPRIADAGCKVRSAQLTENRFYIQATTDRIQSDVQDGTSMGVQGTPTFFLNGKLIEPQSFGELETLIQQALAE